jgi:acyl-CoA thioesterase-1
VIRPVVLGFAAALVLSVSGAAVVGDAPDGRPASCAAPARLKTLGVALAHVAARAKQREPLTIVALGSSSTRGVGASAQQLNYPSRLEVELRQRLPDMAVRVLNRGRSGEEVTQMVARIDRDVIPEHPDLVIWQLGTNAVLHNDDAASERDPIARGIAQIRQSGSDVVLMDLQYAPRIVARPGYAAMEQVIADAAARAHVGLYRRFAIMQRWQADSPSNPPEMIGRDGVHMTDRGYGCLAADLADALAENWRPRTYIPQSGDAKTAAGLGAPQHRIAPSLEVP